MNCRQGDLAMVVRGVDAGKQVTCEELIAPGSKIPGEGTSTHIPLFARDLGHVWRVDRMMAWRSQEGERFNSPYCPDYMLRPLTPHGVVKQLFELEKTVEDREARLVKRRTVESL